MNDSLRFPIGQFQCPTQITDSHISGWIDDIERFPEEIQTLVNGKAPQDLANKYRPDGWTAAQVIHHCADSHMNSVIRFKLALTENVPTIRPYHEELWAELADSNSTDIENTVALLKHLHHRWVILLRSLKDDDLKREFVHPDSEGRITVAENIGIYAWHCRHHLAHVRIAFQNKGQ